MEQYNAVVTLAAAQAAAMCRDVISGSLSGTMLDDYVIQKGDELVRVMVFEKYFHRVGNRLVATVVIDNMRGRTRIHMVSGGGSNSAIFRFNWGAAASFTSEFARVFDRYRE